MRPIKTLAISFLIVFSGPLFARMELQCFHVLPIQMRILQKHFDFTQLTPDLEKRTIKRYIDGLDGSKLFLLEPDMKQIRGMMKGIFEKAKQLDCGPMIKSHELLLQRIQERVAFARDYLGPSFKFNPKLRVVTDPGRRSRAKTTAEANVKFAAQLQMEVANFVASDINLTGAKKHVLQNYERVLKHFQDLKNPDYFAEYLDTFAGILDPHTNYMSADSYDEFAVQMKLSLDGIGATLQWRDGFTTVSALVPGGAAARSGLLKRKDKIVAVAQGDGPSIDVMDMELHEVVKLIRGPAGSKVRLTVIRKAGKENQRLEIPITRAKIELMDQAASITYTDRASGNQNFRIAILDLPSFYHDDQGATAGSDLKRLLAEARDHKADAVVLDLAGNGGGSLQDAVSVAGLFLATGNIVRLGQRGDKGVVYETLQDQDNATEWAGPLVILTNRASASASEIVAGSLQDYHRALIVGGDQTFGKGTLQTVEAFNEGLGGIKVTTGMFFVPGGQSTQHRGVKADIVFPSPMDGSKIGERWAEFSLPPKKIEPFLSSTANQGIWKPLDSKIIGRLKTASLKRIAKSADFRKIESDLKNPKKAETSVTVASLLKGKDPNAGKDGDDDDKDPPPPTDEEKKKQYLSRSDINEALNIAADLALEMKPARLPSSSRK